ncbi:hypothetical protein LDENG_00018660 [Lucifuga dentata]|nr:hypothetical protein LDENG_00018660 [Lucifuga dentata]
MDDDQAVTKTRANSSDSAQSSIESMGSTSGAVAESPLCQLNVMNPSQTIYDKTELNMMLPEEKLKHFESRAQALEDKQEFDACIQDLVRCVALSRLVHGDGHVKLAEAHARLAKAYFKFKGWAQQAQKHSSLAMELLPLCSSISTCREEKLQLEEAESFFLKAEHILEELHQIGGINQEKKIETELEIFTSLFRVCRRQSRPEEALDKCERSLQLLEGLAKPEETCSVYKDMAAIEQDRGHLDRAIKHLSKAHAIAMTHSLKELVGARISHSLALILSTTAEPLHNDSAADYFEQSLSAYRNSVGPQDATFLTVQDDFCRFLLLNGQQERCVEIQKASLALKRSTFGDLSAEVADTLQIIGSVEMTESKIKQAHRTMTKCLKIQNLIYGPQHKKTKATQQAVIMLARAPQVAERRQKQSHEETRNQVSSVVSSSGKEGNSISD